LPVSACTGTIDRQGSLVKQTLLMIVLTLIGTLGVFVQGPFIAVAIYYLFAVLRPQWLWEWALPSGVPWSEYVAIAAVLGLVGRPFTGARERPPGLRRFTPQHAAMLAFALWVSITYFTAINAAAAWPWFLEYAKIFLMFALASLVVTSLREVRIIYLLATGSLVYIAYELNFLYFTAGRLDIYRNGYGGLDNNGAGLMIAMGLPMTIYAWEATKGWARWLFAAGVPLIIHAVLMSYSRGAMVSTLIVLPIILLRSRRRLEFAGMALLIALLTPVLAGREIRERFFSIQNYEEDTDANLRFRSWQAAFRIANEYPLFGAGIRNSNLLAYDYGADMEGRTIHSQYLQIMADSGYPAAIFYVLALAGAWVATQRARRAVRSRDDPEAHQIRSLAAGTEGALLVFCVGASFLSVEVFELPYIMVLLAIQLSVMATAGRPAGARVPASPAVAPAGAEWARS